MSPFSILRGVAAPFPEPDIDTDVIFPARFLLLLDRRGLAQHLFGGRRAKTGGAPFVLDRPPFDKARILVAGRNFGCGSSREQAVWALTDFGFRVIVAPSFGEIFLNNCFRNGLLAIALEPLAYARVLEAAETGEPLEIDLEKRGVGLPGGEWLTFEVDPGRRRDLLLGRDDIGSILAEDGDAIAAFEHRRRASTPWLELDPDRLAKIGDRSGARV